MRNDGRWWYDQHAVIGTTNDPIVISQQVLKDGLLSLDSQTAMARVGCVAMVDGGMTNKLPLERQMTHQLTLI